MRALISALMRPYGTGLQCKSVLKRFRSVTNAEPELRCFRLKDRCVLRVRGQDTTPFLQGLITNDMKLLEDGSHPAVYAHMLSVQGRTLYDLLIYRLKAGPGGLEEVLVECDASVLDSITRQLKTYKIRRKVSFEPSADLSAWALLAPHPGDGSTPTPELRDESRVVVMVSDPRTHLMGWRLVTRNQDDPADMVARCNHGDPDDYQRHRYRLGVPEGVRDLPPGDALPLEANLVFLNGISFSKGCYIGQELTARTHHTGVIRKRLMPVRLSVPAENLPPGSAVESEQGKAVGKLRSGLGEIGLGLVRLSHAHETLTIRSPSAILTASVPDWWPEDFKTKR